MKEKRKQTESYEASHTVRFEKNGITLIALVVTIVILLILAGVSLNLVFRNNGIVTKANLAVVKQENATVAEAMQFKVNYYNMESIEDIKTALQNDGIMDANGLVNTYTLLEQKLKTGNGSNKKDVYVIENGHLYYYEKNEEKTDLGNLWDLKTTYSEEDVSDLFEVDDNGNLYYKGGYGYYGYYNINNSLREKLGAVENLVIPSVIDGKKVKRVSFGTVYDNQSQYFVWKSLKTVTISEGVTTIGEEAFSDCINLKNVNLPNSLTKIEYGAFAGCIGLTSITIPSGVNEIEDFICAGCSNLQNIQVADDNNKYDSRDNCNAIIEKNSNTLILACKNTSIPDSVTCIGVGAYNMISGLASITIPNGVTKIDNYSFVACPDLTSVEISASVAQISGGIFMGCDNLINIKVNDGNNVYDSRNNCNAIIEKNSNTLIVGCKNTTIPNSVTAIGDNAFEGSTKLTRITIPDSVTNIGESAFSYCSELTSITIPDSVTSIGDEAFRDCTELTNIVIPDNVTSIGNYMFAQCTGLTSITIPNKVTSIGDSAFSGCTGLTSITIPNKVTSIGDSAFSRCTGLTSVTIPDSITSIGSFAFYGCTGLTNITIPNSVVNMESYVFCEWKSNQAINCEASQKPDGWDVKWNANCNAQIKWNAK